MAGPAASKVAVGAYAATAVAAVAVLVAGHQRTRALEALVAATATTVDSLTGLTALLHALTLSLPPLAVRGGVAKGREVLERDALAVPADAGEAAAVRDFGCWLADAAECGPAAVVAERHGEDAVRCLASPVVQPLVRARPAAWAPVVRLGRAALEAAEPPRRPTPAERRAAAAFLAALDAAGAGPPPAPAPRTQMA